MVCAEVLLFGEESMKPLQSDSQDAAGSHETNHDVFSKDCETDITKHPNGAKKTRRELSWDQPVTKVSAVWMQTQPIGLQ